MCLCSNFSRCHPEQSEGSAFVLAVALAFLSVIPEGNLLLPFPHPTPTTYHPVQSEEPAFVFALASLLVILRKAKDLLLPLPLLFSLSFPKEICFYLSRTPLQQRVTLSKAKNLHLSLL
jgi:hypothetical protein